MPLPPRSFVRPDRSCYHNTSWTAWAISTKLIRNIRHMRHMKTYACIRYGPDPPTERQICTPGLNVVAKPSSKISTGYFSNINVKEHKWEWDVNITVHHIRLIIALAELLLFNCAAFPCLLQVSLGHTEFYKWKHLWIVGQSCYGG